MRGRPQYGNGDGIGDEKGKDNGEGRGGGGELWYPPHQETSRVGDQIMLLRTRHHRQEIAHAGCPQLRARDPAPAPTGEQGTRAPGTGREKTGTGARTGMRTRAGMRARTGGRVTGDDDKEEGGGEGERDSLGTYEVVIEAGRKTREGGDANE